MLQWAELATLMMLGLATLVGAWNLYLTHVASRLVCQLATDCVHMKLLISLAVRDLQRQGVVAMDVERLSDAAKAKMN